MENYSKGSVVDVEESLPLSVAEGGVVMKVVAGSKIRNLLNYAFKKLKEPQTTQVLWHGSGKAIYKTINCAEIMKRKVKNLYQITQLYEKRVEEHWEPLQEGLDRLKVNRDIPAICILLSETKLDASLPGCQPPGPFSAFWPELTGRPGLGQRTRRPRPQAGPEGAKGSGGGGGWKNKKKRKQEKQAAKAGSSAASPATGSPASASPSPATASPAPAPTSPASTANSSTTAASSANAS